MSNKQILAKLLAINNSLNDVFDDMNTDFMIDNELDVDIVESINIVREVIKKIDAKEYKRIMKEAAIAG